MPGCSSLENIASGRRVHDCRRCAYIGTKIEEFSQVVYCRITKEILTVKGFMDEATGIRPMIRRCNFFYRGNKVLTDLSRSRRGTP
jgi:hypothetical protein